MKGGRNRAVSATFKTGRPLEESSVGQSNMKGLIALTPVYRLSEVVIILEVTNPRVTKTRFAESA